MLTFSLDPEVYLILRRVRYTVSAEIYLGTENKNDILVKVNVIYPQRHQGRMSDLKE